MKKMPRIGSLTLATALATALSVGTLSANSIGTITIDGTSTGLESFSLHTNPDGSISVTVVTLEGGTGETYFTVSTSAGTGGSISPSSQTVAEGNTTSFSVSASSGYSIGSVSGCGGSLSGSTFTTGAITGNCTVSATFNADSSSEPAPSGVDIITENYNWTQTTPSTTENLGSRTSAYGFRTTIHGEPRWGQLATVVTSTTGSVRTLWISSSPGGEPLDISASTPRCVDTGNESNDIRWAQYNRSRSCVLQPDTKYYFNVRNSQTWNGPSECSVSNCRFYLQNQVYN